MKICKGYSKLSDEEVVTIGKFIVITGATVREAGRHFRVSKSTVHSAMKKRLKIINSTLHVRVLNVFEKNKAERHLRGGLATKRKYLKEL